MVFKVSIIVFALLMLVRTWQQYAHQKVTKQWMMTWGVVWCAMFVVALLPQTADVLAQYVGVGRGADLFMYVAILFLFYAEYRTLVRTKRLHEQQTELVRRIAIERAVHPE